MRNSLRCVLAGVVAVGFSACTIWPVDQDPAGMNYRRNADHVLDAVQAYHRDKGGLPRSLNMLVPQYLSALPDSPELHYDFTDGSLAYHYTPSWPQLRPVWCRSKGDTTEWICKEHIV